MSTHKYSIVDRDATPDEAPGLAGQVIAWMTAQGIIGALQSSDESTAEYRPGPRLRDWVTEWAQDPAVAWNPEEVAVSIEPTVYMDPESDLEEATCPNGHHGEPPDGWEEAVNQSDHRTGPGILACPTCGLAWPLASWELRPDFAMGSLAFTFSEAWISESLADEVGRIVAPHRVVLVHGNY